MRKANKKQIAALLENFNLWAKKTEDRVSMQSIDARAIVRYWLSEIEQRIKAGEAGACTQALVDTVNRTIRLIEEGYYVKVVYKGDGNATFYWKQA